MTRTSIGLEKDFANARLHGVWIGDKQVLIANVGGRFYAMGNVCTHKGCRLSGGSVGGETVCCPCHGVKFNIRTGNVVDGQAHEPEPVYPVTVENGELFIDL